MRRSTCARSLTKGQPPGTRIGQDGSAGVMRPVPRMRPEPVEGCLLDGVMRALSLSKGALLRELLGDLGELGGEELLSAGEVFGLGVGLGGEEGVADVADDAAGAGDDGVACVGELLVGLVVVDPIGAAH